MVLAKMQIHTMFWVANCHSVMYTMPDRGHTLYCFSGTHITNPRFISVDIDNKWYYLLEVPLTLARGRDGHPLTTRFVIPASPSPLVKKDPGQDSWQLLLPFTLLPSRGYLWKCIVWYSVTKVNSVLICQVVSIVAFRHAVKCRHCP